MSRPALEVIDGGKSAGRAWLKELYSRYGGTVYGRCRYLLKNETLAEDAMQDVFAKAMNAGTAFRGDASPLTWLLKIATHHCLNLIRGDRARWKDQYQDLKVLQGEGHGGEAPLESRDLVRRSLLAFDEETQAAVVHYYVDDMTLEEVGALLGRSVPTIRKRIRAFAEKTGQAMRGDDLQEVQP